MKDQEQNPRSNSLLGNIVADQELQQVNTLEKNYILESL